MSVYLFMLLWLGVTYAVTQKRKQRLPVTSALANDSYAECPPVTQAVMLLLSVFMVAVFGQPQSDTWLYISIYRGFDVDVETFKLMLQTTKKDPAFTVFNYVIHQLTGGSVMAFRLAIGLVHIIPVIFIFRKYSCNYWLSCFHFITSLWWTAYMMNGIRQFMAVTMIFACTPWILERKWVRVLLVILFVSTFHRSALCMIPFVLIAHGQVFNIWTNIYIAGIAVFVTLLLGNVDVYADLSSIAGYGHTSIQSLRESGDEGAHILWFVVACLPVALAWLHRKRIEEINNPTMNLMVNMSTISAGLWLVASFTSGIMMGRLPIFPGIYNSILLPWLVTHGCKREQVPMYTQGLVAIYLCYYLFFTRNNLW